MKKNGVDENIEETQNMVGKLRPRRGRVVKKDEILGGDSANFDQNRGVESLKRTTRSMKKKEMFELCENFIQNGVENVVGKQDQEESSLSNRSVEKEVNLVENVRIRRTTRSTKKEENVEKLVHDVGLENKITR